MLSRRSCLALPFALSPLVQLAGARTAFAQPGAVEGSPFSRNTVVERARALSQAPFQPLPRAPDLLRSLDYDAYRHIRYRKNHAVWGGTPTRFSVELFAPGFLYEDLVDINVVELGKSYPLAITPDVFEVPREEIGRELAKTGKFAGMRIHYPLNSDSYADEFVVFQGASYFRAVSAGQLYGLSARGLAIDVAEPTGEEFPVFRKFWIERPSSSQDAIVIHGLLDSRRISGAYRFGIYPGDPTRMDVEMTLFPRVDLAHVGLAPLTSMFMHDAMDHPDRPDYRPAVHDSDGLAITTGKREYLWRPLCNPETLQVSAFMDENPAGFGLIQRDRDPAVYQDLEALYHRRPSAWVQPLGDWGKGQVQLLEIPSRLETNDNIVAYWRPAETLRAGEVYRYAYRLTWPNDVPGRSGMARVVRSASGLRFNSSQQQFVVDFSPSSLSTGGEWTHSVSASAGRVVESLMHPNPETGGQRVFVSFDPAGAKVIEFRLEVREQGGRIGETWLYRWTNG